MVVAIENADGTSLPDTYDEAYGEKEFFTSLLIAGYVPSVYNMASMGGGYVFDEATGNIRRNREYEGLNALFTLPIDDTKANPTKVAEYITGLGLENDINEEKLNVEWQSTGLNGFCDLYYF